MAHLNFRKEFRVGRISYFPGSHGLHKTSDWFCRDRYHQVFLKIMISMGTTVKVRNVSTESYINMEIMIFYSNKNRVWRLVIVEQGFSLQ